MKAVVLAAGQGLRHGPLTVGRPKVMLPVGNRPLLEHVLAALHHAEVRDVLLVVGYRAESVQTHFQDGDRFGVRIEYVQQPKPAGSADAMARAVEAAPGEDLLVVPGDNFVGTETLRTFLEQSQGQDALLVARTRDPSRYGVVEVNDDRVARVVEKPAVSGERTISTGIFRVGASRARDVRRYAPSAETGLSDFLTSLAHGKGRLRAVPVAGAWYDVDRPENLLVANSLYLAEEVGGVEGTVEPGASLVGNVRVGKGSRIRSGTYLVGPVVVGEGCEIGPHTVVYGPTSIGDNVTIGPFTELLECLVMADARIASGCTLHHSVLDRGVVLAPRVTLDKAHGVTGPTYGAVLGDGVVLGNSVHVQPGSIVGPNARVAPRKTVGSLPAGTQVV